MLRIRVVLPDPRNPVITVAGIRVGIAEMVMIWFPLSIYSQVSRQMAKSLL
jgi:hypothetical protein